MPYPLTWASIENGDIAILGRKGKGKTYTARGIVERLLSRGHRVIVLDPLSHWWGLKYDAEGTGPGKPVVVFGGEEGDIPITPDMGEPLARLVVSSRMSAVIDVAMYQDDLMRFCAAFFEELYHHNREPLWLVLEEADMFAPQNTSQAKKVFRQVEMIARRGRARGFRLISITQRPANLNKNVMTQLDTLIVHGMTGLPDRRAVRDWLDGCGERGLEVYKTLPDMAVGEAWVWTPDKDRLQRVRFPLIETFDTSKTPPASSRRHAPSLSRTALEEIRDALTHLVEGDATPIRGAQGRKSRKPVVVTATGAAVKHVREAAGLTQEALAELTSSTQSTIARIESGRVLPKTQTLERIAKATGQRLVVDFEPIPGE